jgi:hypothetical protein
MQPGKHAKGTPMAGHFAGKSIMAAGDPFMP